MPMNAVFGIRPGTSVSLERKRRTGAECLDELGRERPVTRLGDRPPEPDGPVLPDLETQLAAGALDRETAVDEAVPDRGGGDRAGGRARRQREPGAALPDPDLHPVSRQHSGELDVCAVRERRVRLDPWP